MQERLTSGGLTLEFLRTQILLRRYLPAPPAQVLDVGGGSGVYASWLAGLGYQVHLVDPVPLHREQAARLGGFAVSAGDARDLAQADASADAVLLLGPLYHLTSRADRAADPGRGPPASRGPAGSSSPPRSPGAPACSTGTWSATSGTRVAALPREDPRTGQHRNLAHGARPGHHRLLATTGTAWPPRSPTPGCACIAVPPRRGPAALGPAGSAGLPAG